MYGSLHFTTFYGRHIVWLYIATPTHTNYVQADIRLRRQQILSMYKFWGSFYSSVYLITDGLNKLMKKNPHKALRDPPKRERV
jgi:hypothetical protein